MRRSWTGIVVIVLLSGALCVAAPPRVVKATPDDGQIDVDPSVRELRVVFDQPMDRRGGMSVVGGGETYPVFIGKPRWADARTFTWAMKLKPNHDYWLSINSDRFTNFTNPAGESAVPYSISFSTRAAGPATDAAAADTEDNRRAITILRQAIDEDYSYRDRLKVDWAARFETFGPSLESASSPAAFAQQAAKVLSAAKDIHVFLAVGEKRIWTHQTGTTPNFNPALLPRLVPGWTEHAGGVATGKFTDGTVYVMIPAWSDEQREGLEAAHAAITDAKAIIIDVRPNGGGDEGMAQAFAGRFIDEQKVYSKNTIRRGGRTEGPFDRVIEPNTKYPACRAPVVVLMGPKNVSSCESFLLMMRQVRGCRLVGDRSYGSSGNPRPVELGNGVTVFLSSWVDMLPDGTELEGKGVSPDVAVKATLVELQSRDPVLQAGLRILGGK